MLHSELACFANTKILCGVRLDNAWGQCLGSDPANCQNGTFAVSEHQSLNRTNLRKVQICRFAGSYPASAEKAELALEAGVGNTLLVKGDPKLGAGSKAVAAITFANKKAVSVRFSVK